MHKDNDVEHSEMTMTCCSCVDHNISVIENLMSTIPESEISNPQLVSEPDFLVTGLVFPQMELLQIVS